MCPNNSITNSDGTCTCSPGFSPDGQGNCVAFDYNNPAIADEQAKWKKYLNDYGPVLLGGFAGWWASQNKPKTTPAATLPTPQEKDNPKIPVWAWIAGGVVLLVILIAVLRRPVK